MDEKKMNEIAYLILKSNTRQSLFKIFDSLIMKESEIITTGISKEEYLEFTKFLILEVFGELIPQIVKVEVE